MELLPLCRAVAEQLDRLDFSSLYPGYHRFPFALYNEEQICLEGRSRGITVSWAIPPSNTKVSASPSGMWRWIPSRR